MTTREAVVNEAKTWIGTKYHHLGRKKNAGVDCVGLIIGIASELKLYDQVNVKNYSRLPNSIEMKNYLDFYLNRIEIKNAREGDILFMNFATTQPQHLSVVSEYQDGIKKIIHAYMAVKKCCEHSFDNVWEKRTVAAYAYRGIE